MHRILHVGWRESSFVVRSRMSGGCGTTRCSIEAIEVNLATDIIQVAIQTAQPLTDRPGKGRAEMNTWLSMGVVSLRFLSVLVTEVGRSEARFTQIDENLNETLKFCVENELFLAIWC